ncbi:MAG: OmpA family protein [Candidatus Korobacteraceae bacterium]|jgi:outer membrane protein OmpA-like peptidoglycan-associated protein
MNRFSVLVMLVAGSLLTVGCATKNYVRNQTTPVINNVNELDDQTAQNTRDIRDTDTRAQQGITQVNSKAATADQKALAAGQTADQANQNATQASNRVTSLAGTVENLDNYQAVADTTVLFGFDKADLTHKDKQTLDDFAARFPNQRHYIVQVEGYTDSTGPADYNYQLSQRRADAVIQYLAQKYNVPAHKIFLIGLGKDNPVAQNTNSAGRAKNRRVDVRLMTNSLTESAQTNSPNQQQSVQQR